MYSIPRCYRCYMLRYRTSKHKKPVRPLLVSKWATPQEETTDKHILFYCPQAASVLNAHRAFILATASPPGVASAGVQTIQTMETEPLS